MNRFVPAILNSNGFLGYLRVTLAFTLCLVNFTMIFITDSPSQSISIEFFWARDCPHCESVKDLVQMLKKDFNIKVDDVDVDTERGYKAFTRAGERFHRTPPAVPLIVVGGEAFMGEAEIQANLEKKIRSLMRKENSKGIKASASNPRSSNTTHKVVPDKTRSSLGDSDAKHGKMRILTDQ